MQVILACEACISNAPQAHISNCPQGQYIEPRGARYIDKKGVFIMATTEIEHLLIEYLYTSKATASTQAIAYILVKNEEQQLKMCKYLSENTDATDEEILAAAHRISGR